MIERKDLIAKAYAGRMTSEEAWRLVDLLVKTLNQLYQQRVDIKEIVLCIPELQTGYINDIKIDVIQMVGRLEISLY